MVANLLWTVVMTCVWLTTTSMTNGSVPSGEIRRMFSKTPANVASVVNGTVTMVCASNYNITWKQMNMNGSIRKILWTGGKQYDKLPKRYNLMWNKDTGQVDVVIQRLEIGDAGLYSCSLAKINQYYTAQLIVLESDPMCDINATHASCSINYDGNGWTPRMRWMHNRSSDGELIKIMDELIYNTNTSTSVSSQASLAALLESSLFECRAYFLAKPDLQINATNIPNYTYNWISPKTTIKQAERTERKSIEVLYEYLANLTSKQAVDSNLPTGQARERQTKPVVGVDSISLNEGFLSKLNVTFPDVPEQTVYAVVYTLVTSSNARRDNEYKGSYDYCQKLIFSQICKSGEMYRP